MNILTIPKWVSSYDFPFQKFNDIPDSLFREINQKLSNKLTNTPKVSVLISAWNEEINILKTIASLADQETNIEYEIIVVNNNSTDQTQDVLDKLCIKSYFQPIQGWGPARQMGLEHANGKYVLLADADCIYPNCWIQKMTDTLSKRNIVCVYGRYSFIPQQGYPRWKLFILETLKDIIAEIRHIKRPYLNAYGISMGYVRKLGLQVGYVMHKIRGEDGRMCFDLMQFGKVKQVKSNAARAWTYPRTLQQSGSFGKALQSRIILEFGRFFTLFRKHPPHDTKTSSNDK